ncbi:hypothetical protein KIW84_051270 [Lathyrus oleraceus]|uniref:Aminotransferase-like plant mobile domain-containing protein n=1 Tax=Pisum sativum TaxID=3888 RepID=A0A9D4WNP9_PEA|nr:hypothetical protein KIW84_051270 [Pisum sativum]
MTDELDSGAEEDSCDDMPVLIRFNEEEPMTKDFIFKVGMEFSSLKQFKKVILEYNIFNGMRVRFSKSDSMMCTVIMLRFAIEITGCMDFKVKNNVRQVVEGDSSLDGFHLKTKYGGMLLIVVGRGPNDQYFTISFEVVQNETKDSYYSLEMYSQLDPGTLASLLNAEDFGDNVIIDIQPLSIDTMVRRRGADGRIPVRTLDRGASSSAAAAEPTGYPGGPYDTSLLVKYEHHVARHIWFGEERGPKKELKVAGHGLKLNSRVPLALPPQMESWDVTEELAVELAVDYLGYSWGAAALVTLYRYLGDASMYSCKQLGGYPTLLQCWIHEYFPTVGKRGENWNPAGNCGLPRAMRWSYRQGVLRSMIYDLFWTS